ncbi:MAG TPA: transcription termination factor NusA [Bacillota bacterium]|mgnify:CR=1 FL=1|jgi:N utilization substance protein A|nr:transcription termination/antitermination protein NusA [Fastidiosipila sp.]HPX92931.1 transcription termination factor NusA [Bacillota bacterium]HQB80679.1 transcription termination factor NusA [Bacillota bacterium]
MNQEFIEALRMLEKERGVEMETLIEAIEDALVAAYRREFEIRSKDREKMRDREGQPAQEGESRPVENDGITAHIDRRTGEMRVYQPMTVVEEVHDPNSELSLAQAHALSGDLELGDQLVREVDPSHFGRLAAQTAKSVINQKLAQAEKLRIQDEFSGRVGGLASGIVQRRDRNEVLVDIGRAQAVLPYNQQSRLDNYTFKKHMRFFIMKVDQRDHRPVIMVSRSHPGLVRRLFEQEVPEIGAGIVEIVNIAREAGSRTKMAVTSHDSNIDPVGACVGQRGTRVQSVITELNGEKIDIIEWDPDITEFISSALSPARVIRVVLDEEEKSARVIVADHQLSLAIGKEGQNARLAAKLTEWKIDIKSESQYREMLEAAWMPDFDEAVAADEAERGDADEEDPVPEETEEELQVDDQETATSYLDRLESTIDSLEEPEA